MQAFEKLVAGAKPPPAALEAFARYLASTGGDSKPEHRARDLAQRAAEAEPTVKRLLLASQLAEDRNQTRVWVDKAAALAPGRGGAGRVAPGGTSTSCSPRRSSRARAPTGATPCPSSSRSWPSTPTT
jgi:hypothetical protein